MLLPHLASLFAQISSDSLQLAPSSGVPAVPRVAAAPPGPLTVDMALSPHIYVFFAAFIMSFVFTPVMRTVATVYGIVDKPDQARKVHIKPIAYLGGIAIFLGWIAGLAISQLTSSTYNPSARSWQTIQFNPVMLLGAFIIVGLGLWDDVRRIQPRLKVGGQVLAAVMLLMAGIGPNCTRPLLSPINERMIVWFQSPLPEWLYLFTGCTVTIALVVFCCNSVNLMDGLDGLAGGVTAIISAGFLFLVTYLAIISGPEDAQASALRIVLALALLGAVLGFVPYNFNPASIFMGDAGSMFLGFSGAILIVMMASVDTRWLIAAAVMFALPVLDTSLAFARRFVNKRPVFSADRMHFHHQLVMRGLTVRRTVLVSYLITIGCVILGAAVVFVRTRFAIAIYMVIFCYVIVAAYKMGMVHEKPVVASSGRKPIGSPGLGNITSVPNDVSSILEIREDEKRLPSDDNDEKPPKM